LNLSPIQKYRKFGRIVDNIGSYPLNYPQNSIVIHILSTRMQIPTIQFPLHWGEIPYVLQPKVLTLALRNDVLPLLQEYATTSTENDMMELLSEYPILATILSTANSNDATASMSQQAISELISENPKLFRLLKNPPLPLLQNERRIRIAMDIVRTTMDTSQLSQDLYEAVTSSEEHQFW
jgi:hypothetical protein